MSARHLPRFKLKSLRKNTEIGLSVSISQCGYCIAAWASLICPSPSSRSLQAGGWLSFVALTTRRIKKGRKRRIFGRGSRGSDLSSARLFRANRPREPIAIKAAPAIISPYPMLIGESRSTYFPFAFSPFLPDFFLVFLRAAA
jgi:hypothetical protein